MRARLEPETTPWQVPTPAATDGIEGKELLQYVGGLDVSFVDDDPSGCGDTPALNVR